MDSRIRIEALQRLAALDLDASQREALQADLDSVVGWLQDLPAAGAPDEPPAQADACVLRPDTVQSSLPVASWLQNVPDHDGTFLRVPRFVDRDS